MRCNRRYYYSSKRATEEFKCNIPLHFLNFLEILPVNFLQTCSAIVKISLLPGCDSNQDLLVSKHSVLPITLALRVPLNYIAPSKVLFISLLYLVRGIVCPYY